MTRVLLTLLVAIMVAAILALGACRVEAGAPAPGFTLKLASSLPASASPALATAWWAREVEKRSNGVVKFEYFWGGSLTKGGVELEFTQSGVTDVAVANATVYPDKLPLLNIGLPVFFGIADMDVLAKVYETVLKHPAMLDDVERYNVKFIFPAPPGTKDLASKEPVKAVRDLKGKRISTIGKWYPKAVAAIGGVAVTQEAPEKYLALQTGLVDSTIFSMEAIYTFKLHEICKHATWLGMGAEIVGTTIVNRDVWNRLPSDVQRIMMETGQEAARWNAKNVTEMRDKAKTEMLKAGVTFYDLPYEEKAKWASAMDNYPAQWAKEMDAKGRPGTELMRLLLDTSKKLGHKFPKEWLGQ